MSEIIIDARSLTKKFGHYTAVSECTFKVEKGSVFGLLGPNGAGKSTLISMLTGVYVPTAGECTVCGLDLSIDIEEIKKVIGVVPQDLAVYQPMSAADNLYFFGKLYSLPQKKLKRRVDEVLEIVGLTEWADKQVATFSGGMKRRLNIAVGLIHNPVLLFLDEPTVGVDPQSRNHILDSVRDLAHEGSTIFYTTHYMEEAHALCDKVAIYDKGRIIAMDTPENLIRKVGETIIEIIVENLIDSDSHRLSGIKGVRKVGVLQDRYLISADNTDVLLDVIGYFNSDSRKIKSIKSVEPSLETVFLTLTGKNLRDGQVS